MTRQQYQSATGITSTRIALASFGIGTVLLVIEIIKPNLNLLVGGFLFVLTATFVNLIVLANLVYHLCIQHNHRDYYLVKILIVLANIPITIVYLKILFN
ncbi:hypothetical protein [Flavobacterium stagni]|uniref:Uncharacterized protein n=1 Tax=Flavobacterium stagni TaxID=2506421 RepID=A0A4Q1KBG1_9FLAO|nr:hypothetical protein [Flavobacterium stagni]RXR23428.1 hypothetical protein EQG61_05525 [Flavobacterium stagni]